MMTMTPSKLQRDVLASLTTGCRAPQATYQVTRSANGSTTVVVVSNKKH